MERYIQFVIRNRLWVLVLVGVISVLCAASVTRGTVGSSLGKMFLGESPAWERYKERIAEYSTDEVILVGVHDSDPLSAESLAKLEAAVAQTSSLDVIWRVTSIFDASRVLSEGGSLVLRPYTEMAREDPTRRAEYWEEMRSDPLLDSVVVSKDGDGHLVVIELMPDDDRPAELGSKLVNDVEQIFVDSGYRKDQIHLAGILPIMGEIVRQAYVSLGMVFPITGIILLVVVFLLFRQGWPVVITSIVSLLAVLWMMGFAVQMDRQINIFLAIAPGVILIVAFSDVIHLCAAYLTELDHGYGKDEAIRRAGSDVGRACFYTSITTAVGFLGLSMVPTPIFRQAGIVLGFGVAVALILAVTLVPILFDALPEPSSWRKGTGSAFQRSVDSFLKWSTRTSIEKPWFVTGTWVLLLGVAILGVTRIQFETDMIERMSSRSKIVMDANWFNEKFGGTAMMDIFVDTGVTEGILDPQTFQEIDELQKMVGSNEDVRTVYSLVDVIRNVHGAFYPEQRGDLPQHKATLSRHLMLFEMSSEQGLDALVDFDRRELRMAVRIENQGYRFTADLGDALETQATEVLGEGTTVEVSGAMILLGDWLDEILAGQRNGVALSFFIISLIMIWGLRSVRAGLISMIPNAIPLVALGGYVGFAWDDVDSDVLLVALIAIGIGVDDTVHFLMRFRTEIERRDDLASAVHATLDFAGRGIIMTTIILALGFIPFLITSYFSTHILGYLLPMILIVALLADILLLPALARLGVLGLGSSKRVEGAVEISSDSPRRGVA